MGLPLSILTFSYFIRELKTFVQILLLQILLELQKDSMVKFLMKIPKLYYTKSHFPLEISQRAFDHLWRMCESYELWCKETKQLKLLVLNIID